MFLEKNIIIRERKKTEYINKLIKILQTSPSGNKKILAHSTVTHMKTWHTYPYKAVSIFLMYFHARNFHDSVYLTILESSEMLELFKMKEFKIYLALQSKRSLQTNCKLNLINILVHRINMSSENQNGVKWYTRVINIVRSSNTI